MTMTTTTSTDSAGISISYQVGADPYPYRGENGERMNYDEAITYMHVIHGVRIVEAHRHLEMLRVKAIHDALTPHVELVETSPNKLYRLEGADPQLRNQVAHRLIREWRMTSSEAADLLDKAPYHPGNLR